MKYDILKKKKRKGKNKMEKKENKSRRIRIGIIVLIIVLIIALIGTIFYLNKDKITKNSNEKSQTSKTVNSENSETTESAGENNGASDSEESIPGDASLIDMSNTENVEIVQGEKVNNSEKITQDRELNGLKLTNIKIQTENNVSMFTADVKNDTGNKFNGGAIKLTFFNASGEEYADFEAWIPEINEGGTNSINAGTTMDIVNATDMKIEFVR